MPHEIDTHEVVRWLNGLEKRCRRLRWIATGSFLLALAAVAMHLPGLWQRNRIEAMELRSPGVANTGSLRLGVEEGHDPEMVLSSTSGIARARIRARRDGTVLDLLDEGLGGRRVALRLSPAAPTEEVRELSDLELRASGLEARWPGSTESRERRLKLVGDDDVLSLEMVSPAHGRFRAWAGGRPKPSSLRSEEAQEEAERDPGAAVVLFDPENQPRIELSLLAPPAPKLPEEGEANGPAPGPQPKLALRDAEGTERAKIAVDELGSPTLVLRDQWGNERARLVLDEEGNASLEILNRAGEVIWRAP